MNKYIKIKLFPIGFKNSKDKLIELLSYKEYIDHDEILLDEDIDLEEYNDDIIISGNNGYCNDFYLDDIIDYYD